MEPTALWLMIFIVTLVLGAGAAWVWHRAMPSNPLRPPAPGVAEMGYGTGRWERERTLWRGTLRRLEIQSRHTDPVPERLQREIAEAQARLAEAERHLREVRE